MPATAETVGAYLAAAGLGYAMPICGAEWQPSRVATGSPAPSRHQTPGDPRNVARHRWHPRRTGAPFGRLTTAEIKRLVGVCGDDLAGVRDRALRDLGFAGALRRSELVAIDVDHLRSTSGGIGLMIPRSKTDASGAGAEIGIMSGADEAICPVRALRAWLKLAEIADGPVLRRGTHARTVGSRRLHPDPVRQILAAGPRRRASKARSWNRSRHAACGPRS